MPAPYLLDTTVLLHWTRNSPQAQAIDANFQLSSSAMRPLVCEVSLGEMLAFSLSRSWGTQKLRRLAELERHVVVVHISDPGVRQAYAELSTLAQSSGWSLFHGKNDLWVGAAAHAADAHLLTMDTDFLPPPWSGRLVDHRSRRQDRTSSPVGQILSILRSSSRERTYWIRGEHRGEQGVARGVPPDIIESRNSFRTRQASAHDDRKRQVQVVAPVTSCRHRAALCAAHLVVPPP